MNKKPLKNIFNGFLSILSKLNGQNHAFHRKNDDLNNTKLAFLRFYRTFVFQIDRIFI